MVGRKRRAVKKKVCDEVNRRFEGEYLKNSHNNEYVELNRTFLALLQRKNQNITTAF